MAHVTVADVATRIAYTVGGSPQSAFTIPFAYFDPTDIVVYVGGVLKTYSTDFSVSGVSVDGGYSGGTVTLNSAVSNTTVVVQRDTPTARTEDFPYPSSTLNIKALNTALDKIAAWAQQLKAKAARALRQPDADTADIGQLPAKTLRANTALIFDANGDPAVGVTPGLTLPVPIAQGGTGQTTENAALYALIAAATVDTAPNIATDKIGWAKQTGTTGKSMTFQAFWNLVNSLTAYTTLNAADEMALRDGSGGGNGVRKMTVANFLSGHGYQGRNIAGRNGGCEVWQRGTSIALAASSPAYTLDGWYLGNGANQAATVSQQAGLTAGSRFCARVQRNSGQTGTGTMLIEYPLDADEAAALSGQIVTLSFTARCGVNFSPAGTLIQASVYDGTANPAKRSLGAYTADESRVISNISLTTTATRYQITNTVAIQAGVRQASIYIAWAPSGTAGANDWFEIDDVQLEVAPFVTPFERRPLQFELLACQRMLRAYTTQDLGSAVSTNALYSGGSFPFGVPMRSAPSLLSGATYAVNAGSAGTPGLTNATATGTGFNNPSNNWTVNALVQFTGLLSAEI